MQFKTLADSPAGPAGTIITVDPSAPLPIGLAEGELGPMQLMPLCTEASAALANYLAARGLQAHSRPQSHGGG